MAGKAEEKKAEPEKKGEGLTLHVRMTDELKEAMKQIDLASLIRDEVAKVREDVANLYRRFFGEAR